MATYQNPLEAQTALTSAFNPTNQAQIDAIARASALVPTITAASLAPTQPYQVPQPQPDNNNYNTDIAHGSSLIDTHLANFKTDSTAKDTSSTDLISMLRADPVLQTGTADTELAAKDAARRATRAAQAELAATQARVQSIVDRRDAENLQLEQTINQGTTGAGGAGALASGSFLNVRQQEVSRRAAIEALPLQGLALAQAAKVAALQGEEAYAQSTLAAAQDKLDKAFKLQYDQEKSKVDLYNKQIEALRSDFTAQETKQATAIQSQISRNQADLQDVRNAAQTAFQASDDKSLYAQFIQLGIPDVMSKTFAQDLQEYQSKVAALQGQIKPDQLKQLQIQKAQQDLAGGGSAGSADDLNAYASQYADTGKLPSPAELKLSGLNVGQVTSMAKQMPKPSGALVSTNTGVKSSALSPIQEQGITALSEIVQKTLPNMQKLFPKISTGVLGGLGGMVWTSQNKQDYLTFRAEFLSKLLVARSGAAVTEQEYARYSKMLPTTFNQPFFLGSDGLKKLNSLQSSMVNNLDTILDTQQLSIYGYSKVKVGGVDRKVGEVLDIGGTQYKVLPDGTLTDII